MGIKGTLNFKTNIQLKSIIGKDLINDDNIAILELVKNAFDADAKKVVVRFDNLTQNDDHDPKNESYSPNTSRLIIEDDGLGMTLTDIADKWLNIAYSEKKSQNRQHNRMMAGNKGVGRFSCDRLGEYLNLYTKHKSSSNYIQLKIDWKKFEVDNSKDTEIQSVPLDYIELTEQEFIDLGFEPKSHGVILEVVKLRSYWAYYDSKKRKWDVDKFVNLKKYLEKLINPNQAFEKDDFGIYLSAPEFKAENEEQEEHNQFIGKIANRIFEQLDFKTTSIESKIIDNGKVVFTELKDKNETIFWIKEKNEHYPLIKNASIFLYYLNPYAKAFFTRQTGVRSVDYGSIFLFVNGFRVPPFGEVGDDWLGIDQRKSQGHSRYIGLREFVGRIEILDKDNDFKIISSREGIVKNESYSALTDREDNKSYFFKTLRRLERYVVDGLSWDSSIYDPKDPRFKEIERKIISGETEENELKFRESDATKRHRIYQSIHSIIAAKPRNVIELYINENLIQEKINHERLLSEREFTQLLDDFENKKIDPNLLSQILIKKAAENQQLQKQIRDFSKYSTSEMTSKAILELQDYQQRTEEQENVITELKRQLEEVEKEREAASLAAELAKQENEDALNELIETRSQNLFLKSIRSQELNDVLNLMHHIGISASSVQNYIKGTVFRLENNIKLDTKELKSVLSNISYELNKIYSISKFATKANFKVTTTDTSLNIIEFLEEYLINVVKPFLPQNVNLILYESATDAFTIKFKPLELIIVIDNLINNSRKAGATVIEVRFNLISEDEISISIRDNGSGISNQIRDKIFDFGFTTTEGSGLGLAHVKEVIEQIGGEISFNPYYKEGAEFTINLKK